MGYILKLGYPNETLEHEDGFEPALVTPFRSGSTAQLDPETPRINEELDIAPWETGGDTLDMDQYSKMPLAVDDSGKVPAIMEITCNYNERIREIIGGELSSALYGRKAGEGAAVLMQLLVGLEPQEDDTENYWVPTDTNIKSVADTALDWVFQHPDATFRIF